MAAVSSKFDGFTTHIFTSKKIDTFVEHFEEHMKWLEEVLVEARNTFASTEIELLPKTPAVKRKRQKRKVAEVSSAEESHTESDIENKGAGRAKRNKRSSPIAASTKQESATVKPLQEIQLETTTETDETDTAASVETAQPTVQVSQESEGDEKPKRTRGKRAPPRASKRTTRRTTRSMLAAQKRKVATTDESCTEDESTASDTSQSSRPKRGRPAKKKKAEPEPVVVADSGIETRSSPGSTTNGDMAKPESPTQSKESVESVSNVKGAEQRSTRNKAKGNKFVDHVKRLINVHEQIIQDHSSEDEFQSPKRRKAGEEGNEMEESTGVMVPETPDKETQTEAVRTTPAKFFPPIATEDKEDQEVDQVSKESDESEKDISSPDQVVESIQADTDTDDDSDNVASVELVQENAEPSPEKVAPLAAAEDLESSQEEAVVEQKTEEEEPQQEPEESEEEKEEAQNETENESMEEDSLNNVSVASSSSRSTRSRTSVRYSTRRSNRPSVNTSKSKRHSVLGRRSSIRQSMRTVTRSTRASMKRTSRIAGAPPVMEILSSDKEEEQQQGTPEFKPPDSESRAPRKVVDSTTQIRRTTRSRIRESSTGEPIDNQVQMSRESTEQFEDSLEAESRPPTRGSSRLKAKKMSESSSSSSRHDSLSPPRNRSPSPDCPANKVIRPHPASFLNALMKKNKPRTPGTPTNLRGGSGVITSFIKRNTPIKKTLKEKQQEMKVQIAAKRKREEEIRKKVEAEKKNKIEEQKRKREERIRKVHEARQLRDQRQQQQKRQAMEAKFEKKQVMSAQKQEEKRKEELQKRRQMMKKKGELEERRRQEEEARHLKLREQEDEAKRQQEFLVRKKEMEDSERHRRMEEARQKDEERKMMMEKQRQALAHKKLEMRLALEREQQQHKEDKDRERQEMERKRFMEAEERERAIRAREEAEEERRIAAERVLREKERLQREKERQQEQQHLQNMMQSEREKVEQERLKTNILKHNTSLMNNSINANTSINTSNKLNTTVTKEPAQSPQSYQITPQRTHKPSTDEDYGISDLKSDDSSDDEEAPRKQVPSWAKGAELKAALINQYYKPPTNLEEIFPPIMDGPDLTIIFKKKTKRFMTRTSSAHWSSPIWKPGMF
ncbi:uncharacterized protein [Amphiura filiformis]|uniref:uncharacterized protein n=1 Tax=Amphiura filiformis TaxID=82378 RepID=UPI003B21694A